MDLDSERRARIAELIDGYKSIAAYRKKPRRMNYVRFDYEVSHELALFMLEPDFDFDALDRSTDAILGALPAIKRIFAQPFIHLKEKDTILPVESVRIVTNNTLTHIASHSELWTDVVNGEIKPEKLLSRTYEDNYGIYENLVFCNVIDDVLAIVRNGIKFLRELIYSNRAIEIDLLERVNHINYFLALGKLHIGYSKSFDAYYADAARRLNKLRFIENTIVPRLKRPVYKNNRLRPENIKLHKTNILSMHKEYHRVYKLAKTLAHGGSNTVREITEEEIDELFESYFFFCRALLLFAIGHFGFACDEKKIFDLARTAPPFKFKKWTLETETKAFGADWLLITLRIVKDKPYDIIIIPSLAKDNAALLEAVKAEVRADEYMIFSPYDDREKSAVYIDIASIESFRRIQRIVLRGMIYSDEVHADCPFCSNALSVNAQKSAADDTVYECLSCRTEIHETRCPELGKPYYYTDISGLETHEERADEFERENMMYFRNITDLDYEARPVCPHCGKTHR